MTGVGRQVHPALDWGQGWAHLRCNECKATWTGPIGETCTWCVDAEERQRMWQAELVLRKPDVDPDDRDYGGAMKAWRQRLKIAVEAELITETKARNAWEQATR